MPIMDGSRHSIPFLLRCETIFITSNNNVYRYLLYSFRYQDSDHQHFGSLRVMNEDRVEPHTGFGTHGHREFEIFSYVVAGELEQ
jgi:redox-sensitive bicupin YhaK (pirin superfamily)